MLSRGLAGLVLLLLLPGLSGCNETTSRSTASASPTAPAIPVTASPPVDGLSMKGTVSDTVFRSLPGATIEVLDGPQAGVSTTANAQGHFALTGAFDESTRFRASREGYVASTRTLQPFCERCNPNWWINFALDVPDAPANIVGDYTLTFVAHSTCTTLPDDMRSRTFTATIPAAPATPSGYRSFLVGGATFFEDWNAVGFGVAGDYVALWLETLVEQIAPNTFLAFGGQAAGRVDPSSISRVVLPFQGQIEHCVTTAEQGRYPDCSLGGAAIRRCGATHQLILTQR